ncbi:pseudouridine synthase [Syncephalis fuscata]|nr:pseudouridine synthase [Syncephalis fuscata]
MGFCGTGYQGMQVNPGAKTIEGDLFRAMIEAGAVSRDNADDHKKIGLMRAARTDKGVHAAGQAVSLKMIIEDPSIVDKVNALLPEQIRVWGFVRCINSFHAKNMCDSRIYEYLLPTYVLQPREAFGVAGNTAVTTVASSIDASGNRIYTNVETGEQHTWTAPEPSTPEEMAQRRTYRINQVTLEKVRQALSSYEGTHNYHNYTCGKRFSEESAKRFIISFKASDPFIQQGTEWLSLKVHGQSFMIHQIRKMVSMMVLLVRSETPFTVIPQSFEATRINIPKAPGLGLLLEQTVFGSYNRKCIETGREQVTFEKYQDKIDAFKRAYIYERIVEEEIAVNEFDSWIKSVDARMHYFPFINKEGIVTEADEVLSEGGDDTEVAAEE